MTTTNRSERRQVEREEERRREEEMERVLAEGRPPLFEAPAKGRIVESPGTAVKKKDESA